jgi:ABC-type bacteriocin/lantibiotic exporter with double-glycine peptidase domain
MQHPPLFSGTISENILYGVENPDYDQMLKVSKLSLADHFIKKLPDGYETEIGEDGVLLSGGERQRIAIARALVRSPKMLILDEPTNHLDEQVIKEIMANLEGLEDRPSILLISHDMNVVNFAQKIYKLDKGNLIAIL